MRLDAFELEEPLPELENTHVIAMLSPWINVGSVGGLLLSWMEEHFKAQEMGKLARPGEFYDFTRYRPTIYWDGDERKVSVPNTTAKFSKTDEGRDLIFLRLLEPHSRSEDFVESVLALIEKFNVSRYSLLGSMYDYAPHTRPLRVTGGAQGSQAEKDLDNLQMHRSNYQGPTTITTLIGQQAWAKGVETMTLIAHLPQYTQMEEDFMGTVPMMDIISPIYNLPVNQPYIAKANNQHRQIDEALENNQQLKTIVEQLEKHYDDRAARRQEEEQPKLSPEVERFLAEMDRRFREE